VVWRQIILVVVDTYGLLVMVYDVVVAVVRVRTGLAAQAAVVTEVSLAPGDQVQLILDQVVVGVGLVRLAELADQVL
jgi:hypothetical protein